MKMLCFFLLKTGYFWRFHDISKTQKLQGKVSDNLGQRICSLFRVLVQFLFTKSETELDYYREKQNVRVTHELSNDLRLSIFQNQEISWKFLKCLDLITSTQPSTLKANFETCGRKSQKISFETLHRKPILLNFASFSAKFCPR